jgi:DinB superfamily/Pentapeptide repeats (8 copies)
VRRAFSDAGGKLLLGTAAVVGSGPIRDNDAVPAEYDGTDDFRGASFTGADFTGANFRDCDLRQAKITDSWLIDLSLSGLVGNLVVNDVDVTAFVEGELDRRHPERVQLREMRTADDYRAMWDRMERLWAETVARAGRLLESALRQRVDDEWSFVETLRHLVLATDKWAGYMILDKPMPYHPFGLPQPGCTPADAAALGIDLDVRPPLAEVLEVRGTRMRMVRGIVLGLSDDDLARECPRLPGPGYPEETYTLGSCLRVIMNEECEHRRYAVRDLAVLEANPGAGAAHHDPPP